MTALKLLVFGLLVFLHGYLGRVDGNFQAALEMWALHKILSTVRRKPRPTKPFFDGFFRIWQSSTSRPHKFSTEGCRAVIYCRKYKQFDKIDANLATVEMYSDLRYTSMNIIMNKCTHAQLVHHNVKFALFLVGNVVIWHSCMHIQTWKAHIRAHSIPNRQPEAY